MVGAALALALITAPFLNTSARAADASVTPSLRCAGGWTDNANGGVDNPSAARAAAPVPANAGTSGGGVVAGVQCLWAANRSRSLVNGPSGLRERYSWAGPGAVVSAGIAPTACALVTVAAQMQQRGYRDWIAGTPPARVTGQVLGVAAAGSWACSRLASVVVEYAFLRHDAADPALRLRAHRVSLGLSLAPRLPL